MLFTPARFLRVIAIQRVLIRHGFDEMLFATPWLRSLSFVRLLLPWNWVRHDYAPRAASSGRCSRTSVPCS